MHDDRKVPISDPDLEALLRLHVGKDHANVPLHLKQDLLRRKLRRLGIMVAVNLMAILLFGYSFLNGVTQLPAGVFYGLLVVFGLNMGLLFYQRKGISRAMNALS